MIKYEADQDGDLVISVDDETAMGTYVRLNMGDDKGITMLLELARFYDVKGHDVRRLVDKYLDKKGAPAPSMWQIIKHLFGRP